MPRVRVAACQINTVVGDLDGNARRIAEALDEAERAGADLAVFPELTVTGYPPEDLLGRPAFVADNQAVFARIAAASGTARRSSATSTPTRPDACSTPPPCVPGAGCSGRYHKRLLPNYGVFDEQRWFVPGDGPRPPSWWPACRSGSPSARTCGSPGVRWSSQAAAGARLLVNLNASPYSRGRREERLAVLAERVAETGCPDRLREPGRGPGRAGVRRGVPGDGRPGARWWPRPASSSRRCWWPTWTSRSPVARRRASGGHPAAGCGGEHRLPPAGGSPGPGPVAAVLDPEAEVYQALVLGTRDYVGKNGFTDAVIGLSGGIDSSLVAAIAVDALGPEHVHGVTMPSALLERGLGGRRGDPGRQPGHRPGHRAHRGRPPGPGLHAWPR